MPASQEADRGAQPTTYSFRGDRLLLEPKDKVKARLGYSPDDADAFALTFAQPAAAWQSVSIGARRGLHAHDSEKPWDWRARNRGDR